MQRIIAIGSCLSAPKKRERRSSLFFTDNILNVQPSEGKNPSLIYSSTGSQSFSYEWKFTNLYEINNAPLFISYLLFGAKVRSRSPREIARNGVFLVFHNNDIFNMLAQQHVCQRMYSSKQPQLTMLENYSLL